MCSIRVVPEHGDTEAMAPGDDGGMPAKDVRFMDVNREHPDMPNLLVTGDQTQGRFALVETVARHTDETPLHSHSQEDELIYVLNGDVTFYVDGIRLERPAGSCVLLPKGSEHSYSIESEEARLLVLLMPAGLEGYYQEVDEFAGADQDIDRLITVSARYGVYITGPGPPEAR